MKIKLLVFGGLLFALTAVILPAYSQTGPEVAVETVTINPNSNQLQSLATIEAPFAFNAVVPSWIAEESSPDIEVRTSKDGINWSEWFHIRAHDDWTLPEDVETSGDMIVVPVQDETHSFIQYEIHDEHGGEISSLSFTFIDTTDGPTTEEMLVQQQQLDAQNRPTETNSYPRPSVISRAVWCTYSSCNYTAGLVYEPVTNMIVHHTVSSNSSSNWAATVRAIYIYHSETRGWGDIGYNYLVDRNGAIYEGHMNQDYYNLDVVGTHAGDANAGGLGTSLIGTFTTADEYDTYDVPPAAMMNSVANLFAWKADQRNIQIYDATQMVNMDWGLPNIMGHRDVYGGTNTLCPGGNAHALLPSLRADVAYRIGQTSPYSYVSETGSGFIKSNSNWYEALRGCGWQGHAYYTWSTTNPAESTNWGEWTINVPTSGMYEIQVYAPYCDTDNSETNGATYTIDNGVSTRTAVVSHQQNVGLWMSLGSYQLNAGNNTLRLTDLTTTDNGVGVWFDDIRYSPATDVNVTNQTPANNIWVSEQTVDFDWTFNNGSLVQEVTLEIATDDAFNNIIESKHWQTAVTSAEHTFTQDYQDLYWRVFADTGGAIAYSTPTHFSLDFTPPASNITSLTYHAFSGQFDVTWAGHDSMTGVAGYNIDYKQEGDAQWTRWLSDTPQLSGSITLPANGETIWFRSQATDLLGNVEAENNGDMSSDDADVIFNPEVENDDPVSKWSNQAEVTFSWSLTEIDTVTQNTIEVATDEAFTNIVITDTTNIADSYHTFTPTTLEQQLYWRVKTEFTPPLPGLTSSVMSEPTWFGYDATPPTSTVTAVYIINPDLYLVRTEGVDPLSGISQIDLEYRSEGETEWTLWSNGAVFAPPDPDLVYQFRSRAIDLAGNQEPPHATPDTDTSQANPVPHAIMLPVINK